MNKFVLVGTQRSGTTYILHCLNSHEDVLCHGEIFFKNYPNDVQYHKYLDTLKFKGLRHLLFRSSVVNRFLDGYYSLPNHQAIGFKLMYGQTRWAPYRFPEALAYIKNNDVSVIHVSRHTVLKTHLSSVRAKKRRIFHAKQHQEKQALDKIDLDIRLLIPALTAINNENKWWEKTLQNTNSMSVTYESFVSDKDFESKRILDFLSIDNYQQLSSPNSKISSDKLADSIENYDEVIKHLTNSSFEFCLD